MAKHKCIYCLQEKDETAFNREHVVPRMMGTYQNGYVLSNYEVCEECNSYFSRELEDKIGLNSIESFLRMQHGREMSDGRTMRRDRTRFYGTEGIFKGLEFIPVVDNQNLERIHFNILPKIGIQSKEREDATPYLKEKGYLSSDYKYEDVGVKDLYDGESFTTKICVSIDSIVRRTCAKTVFNYLCYSKGKDFVLSSQFDDIRNYIRYGTWSNDLWFRYSQGPVSSVSVPNDSAHVVGYMWYPENENWVLCGCVTWFGETTYIFKLGATEQKVSKYNFLSETKMACFDNVSRNITVDEAVHIFAKKN